MSQDWLVPFETFRAGAEGATNGVHIGVRHGSMLTLLYAPKGQDPQTPHRQDEIYIVQSGSGVFDKAGEKRPFGPGDVIFVEANVVHRFEDFTDDFAVWAVFWGPDGGEAETGS